MTTDQLLILFARRRSWKLLMLTVTWIFYTNTIQGGEVTKASADYHQDDPHGSKLE